MNSGIYRLVYLYGASLDKVKEKKIKVLPSIMGAYLMCLVLISHRLVLAFFLTSDIHKFQETINFHDYKALVFIYM